MSCSTVGFIKLSSMSQETYNEIKSKCDKRVNEILSENKTKKELFDYPNCKDLNAVMMTELEKSMQRKREKAKYYKDNIEKYKTLVKLYFLSETVDNEVYVNYKCDLGRYIRISNYPYGIFRTADEIINLCEKYDWAHAFWFDDETNDLMKAEDHIDEAKERIKKMFEDNPNMIVKFL